MVEHTVLLTEVMLKKKKKDNCDNCDQRQLVKDKYQLKMERGMSSFSRVFSGSFKRKSIMGAYIFNLDIIQIALFSFRGLHCLSYSQPVNLHYSKTVRSHWISFCSHLSQQEFSSTI